MIEYLIPVIIAKWFWLMRQPDEIFSSYNRALIPIEDSHPILHKVLTCDLCHCGYAAIVMILNGSDFLILPTSMLLIYYLNKVK